MTVFVLNSFYFKLNSLQKETFSHLLTMTVFILQVGSERDGHRKVSANNIYGPAGEKPLQFGYNTQLKIFTPLVQNVLLFMRTWGLISPRK